MGNIGVESNNNHKKKAPFCFNFASLIRNISSNNP